MDIKTTKFNMAISALLKQKEQIDARIQSLKAKDATQQRKDDTRRKILIGAYILEKHEKAGSLDSLRSELEAFLFKTHDRALFGLLPKNENDTAKEGAS